MAKIIVYNNSTDRMETYYRGESQPMPYNTNNTLLVREFRGSSNSSTLWTTKNTMLSWNSQRYLYGAPIPVGYAFKRPWEGGHGSQSQHYAGTAFDVGQKWTNAQRAVLRNSAQNSRIMELCGNICTGFQNNMIIEEKLTASYIPKVSTRNEYLEKFKEYKTAYRTKWNRAKANNNEQKYLDDIQNFISDMKPFNKLLKEDKLSKEEYLKILNKRKKEIIS